MGNDVSSNDSGQTDASHTHCQDYKTAAANAEQLHETETDVAATFVINEVHAAVEHFKAAEHGDHTPETCPSSSKN